MPPSTGASTTRRAAFSPIWGRAAGALSTFTPIRPAAPSMGTAVSTPLARTVVSTGSASPLLPARATPITTTATNATAATPATPPAWSPSQALKSESGRESGIGG